MTFSRADHVYDNDVVVICRLLCFSFRSIYIYTYQIFPFGLVLKAGPSGWCIPCGLSRFIFSQDN